MNIPEINLKLTEFINCNKFEKYVDLQPAVANSTPEDVKLINELFNDTASQIQNLITTNTFSEDSGKKIILESVDKIDSTSLDTEDSEFCYELIAVLSEITGISIEKEMKKKQEYFLSTDMLTNIMKKGGLNPKDFGL